MGIFSALGENVTCFLVIDPRRPGDVVFVGSLSGVLYMMGSASGIGDKSQSSCLLIPTNERIFQSVDDMVKFSAFVFIF